ncbi:MAG: hypothetical protein EOL87_14170 [Spartobacteria bacterium]|nr:hypothetical protein [Spartobacteria bacterium]
MSGLYVNTGHDITVLARALATDLQEDGGDIFRARRVIVPDAKVARWLKMELAEVNGVAANMVCPFTEKGFWELLTSLLGIAY